jgi:hypothetical protein
MTGIVGAGRNAVGAAAPWIVRAARLGYVAKGVVYIVIGALAARAAAGGDSRTTTDSSGALRTIGESGLGSAALAVIGVGLIGYALWAVLAAASDAEDRGGEAKGIAIRVGQAGRGIAYGALGVEALRLLGRARDTGSRNAEHWTGRLLDAPFGRWLVIAVGIGIIAYALYQLRRASSDKVHKHLELHEATAHTRTWVVRLGRFGIAARGIVFVLIGWFLVRAAMAHDASRAGGIDASLAALARQPRGELLLGVAAAGLIAYGTFQLANARYRRMRVT